VKLRPLALTLASALAVAAPVALAAPATADHAWYHPTPSEPTPTPTPTSYQRGPAPTVASIEATSGPFAVATTSISDFSTPGFGAANITYPTSTTQGTFGVVAISPAYTLSESTIAWLRPRIASQGFVVISFDTNSRYDQPSSRGDQLLAALDYVTGTSSVRSRVDATRQAVIGHSMGGGGTLEAAKDRPSLEAIIGLAAWNTDKTWPEVQAANLQIGVENDTIAPAGNHAVRFYETSTNAEQRAYLELDGEDHFAPSSPNTEIARNSIAWLKRFVDNDTRYSQFFCGSAAPATGWGSDYSGVRITCPV
jgi:predicted dienelactone hydrolase